MKKVTRKPKVLGSLPAFPVFSKAFKDAMIRSGVLVMCATCSRSRRSHCWHLTLPAPRFSPFGRWLLDPEKRFFLSRRYDLKNPPFICATGYTKFAVFLAACLMKGGTTGSREESGRWACTAERPSSLRLSECSPVNEEGHVPAPIFVPELAIRQLIDKPLDYCERYRGEHRHKHLSGRLNELGCSR